MAAAEYDFLFQILLIGDGSAGKTELLRKFVGEDDEPSSFITTIGIDFKFKRIELDGKVIKLQMWDTAGQERFRTITAGYYKRVQGILLVFDLTDEHSFNDIRRRWVDEINKFADPNAPKILIGNKCAQTEKRVIESERAQALADELKMIYIETDSADGTNVEKAFMSLAEKIFISLSLLVTPKVEAPKNSNENLPVQAAAPEERSLAQFLDSSFTFIRSVVESFTESENASESKNGHSGGPPSPTRK